MTSAEQIEHPAAAAAAADDSGLSDSDGFLVPSPIPTRRTRTYSQYVVIDASDVDICNMCLIDNIMIIITVYHFLQWAMSVGAEAVV